MGLGAQRNTSFSFGRLVRHRATPVVAVTAAAALAAGAVLAVGDSAAGAASSTPGTSWKTASVGRFLDGSLGGNPIESLADLKDARANAPGSQTSQNPLDATLLGKLEVPLSNSLKLPGGGAFTLGGANQVAVAKTTGYAYGGSGAVSNSGGAALGGNDNAYPANATMNLSTSAVSSTSVPISSLPAIPGLPTSIPGLPSGGSGSLASLGGVSATIGAVSALAKTNSGGTAATPTSGLATLKLTLGSPALGALLSQLNALLNPSTLSGALGGSTFTTQLQSLLGGLTSGGATLPTGVSGVLGNLASAGSLPGLPGLSSLTGSSGGSLVKPAAAASSTCDLGTSAPATLSFDQGAVTVDPKTGTITVDVATLLKVLLGKDITNLNVSNFDVISFVVQNLPKILSSGLENTVTGITNTLQSQFTACSQNLTSSVPGGLGGALGSVLTPVTSALSSGQTQLINAINSATAPLTSQSSAPLAQLASGLKQLVDMGLNVQSGRSAMPKETTYPFTTNLAATPDQATSALKNQTLVRALEIHVGGSGASVALGNAAVGSEAVDATPTPTATPTTTISIPTNVPSNSDIPTGIPAGQATVSSETPTLPLLLVLLAILMAGGGAVAYQLRRSGRSTH